MKIDDLITEAPMGILKHAAKKLTSFVPGSTGARAQGELDVGRVANQWKKDYAHYLGQAGAEGFGDTKSFISFLKNLGFTHQQMNKVFKGGGFQTESIIYEAALTSKMIDTLMIRAARVAAMARYGAKQKLPKEPNPTAPRKPGAVDAAVDIGKAVVPGVAKAAGQVGAKLGQKAFDYGKQIITTKGASQTPKQRIEPTMGTPVPAAEPKQVLPKFEPSRQAPKMKTKQVTKYK
jgi:hypothetical protein